MFQVVREAFNLVTYKRYALLQQRSSYLISDLLCRVLVLDKGYVVEFDSPENLLRNRDGIFYSMAKEAGLVGWL